MQKIMAYAAFLCFCLAACKSDNKHTTAAAADASAILNHRYWVLKPYHDALFAANVADTLGYLDCFEVIFPAKDTIMFTSCLSDAGFGIVKPISNNTIEIVLEGLDSNKIQAVYNEQEGVLYMEEPWSEKPRKKMAFVPKDEVAKYINENPTIALARARLAGKYNMLPEKGKPASNTAIELHADGSHTGLGKQAIYEPYPAGIGSVAVINPNKNVMYLYDKGKELEQIVLAWALNGDTLRLWNTKSVGNPDDLPEYQPTTLKGVYIKEK